MLIVYPLEYFDVVPADSGPVAQDVDGRHLVVQKRRVVPKIFIVYIIKMYHVFFLNHLFSFSEYRHNTAFYYREKLDIWDNSLYFCRVTLCSSSKKKASVTVASQVISKASAYFIIYSRYVVTSTLKTL